MVRPMFLVGKNPDEAGDDMDVEEVGVALLVAARELIVVGAFYDISSGIVDSFAVADPSTETSVCARDRTNSRLSSALAERIGTTRRDLRNALPCGRILCSSSCRMRSDSASEGECGTVW